MSQLKSIRLPASANLKLFLVLMAFAIVAGTLWFTQRLVDELQRTERDAIELYARTFQDLLNDQNDEATSTPQFNLAIDLGNTISFPMIQTDGQNELQPRIRGKDTTFIDQTRNIDLDTTLPGYLQLAELRERIEGMKSAYEPLVMYSFQNRYDTVRGPDSAMRVVVKVDGNGYPMHDSTVIAYVYFEDSTAIKELSLLPYVEITIVTMFILVGYIGFSHVKRNEQSNIWVGMAKETAHQLGTPLSSLMGWVELLRYMPDDAEQVIEAAGEMERDIDRLNRVAQRFSKIGSAAELKRVEVGAVLENVIRYFERRLPHLGKRVVLSLDAPEKVWVSINVDLFEWVFENLVRNAADAIDRAEGEITFHVQKQKTAAVIDVTDNGRGIDPKIKKDIFRPGFSTKQRGWGLGLSLARRIVEEYHKGKISIKDTSAAGTTFRIRLNAVEPPAAVNGDSPPAEGAPERIEREYRKERDGGGA